MRALVACLLTALVWLPAQLAEAAEGDPPGGDRVAGADRYATAAAAAEQTFGRVAFVASGTSYPDALAAAPAAAVATESGSPILLTGPDDLPTASRSALTSKEPEEIVVVGGSYAVSDEVVRELRSYSPTVRRLAGGDRYETAAVVALDGFAGPVDTVLIATGENFPDALAAGGVGAVKEWPLLLTQRSSLPDATADALDALRPVRILIVGESDVVSSDVEAALAARAAVVERVGGADRYATAAALVGEVFATPAPQQELPAILVSGANFPDALAAGALAGNHGIPMLLVRPECIPEPTVEQLLRLRVERTMTVGGRAAVAPEVTAGLGCDRPCPTPDRPLEFAAEPDPRVCVLLASVRLTSLAWSAFDAELIVRNLTAEPVDITHPSSCAIFYGRYTANDGRFAGYGPSCPGGPTGDTLGPGERRMYPISFQTGQDDGGWVFAAGVNVGAPYGNGIGQVWYARERALVLAAP